MPFVQRLLRLIIRDVYTGYGDVWRFNRLHSNHVRANTTLETPRECD
jgi:hypothetical protein